MKVVAVVLFACSAAATDTNPVTKTIQLLSDLEAKIIKEGAVATKTYEEFAEWCEDRSKELHNQVKTLKREVEGLKATIEKAATTIAALTAKIEELSAAITVNEKDLAAAQEIRAKEAADFKAEEAELVEVISAIERAIAILSREMSKTGSASLMQLKKAGGVVQALEVLVKASAFSSADANKLTAFLQNSEKLQDDDAGAPAAAAYESKSGNIVQTLEDLLGDAKEQLDSTRKTETADANNFEVLAQTLTDEVKYSEKELAEAKSSLAETAATKAAAEGDLSISAKSLAATETELAGLHQNCMEKSQDFEAETKSRGEELAALAGAKKALSEATSGAGGAEDVAYGLNQEGVSLLQTNRLATGADLAKLEAVRLVRDLGRKLKSTALTQLATRMANLMRFSGGDDAFAKVKDLIRGLIEKLLKEAQAEAEEKAYCDKELGETYSKRDSKQDEIEKLTVAIDQMTARKAQLTKEVKGLMKDLADLAATQARMDKIRRDEHELYLSQKSEMEEGLQGVKLALKILKEYYGGEADHEAAAGAAEGIIGLIEVIESDFTKELIEIEANEKTSDAEYDAQTKENEIMKATMDQDVTYKGKEIKDLAEALASATSDRATVQEELAAVMDYLKSIESRCLAKPATYEDRVKRREAEIAGLKDALEILNSDEVLTENKARAASLLQRGAFSLRRSAQ